MTALARAVYAALTALNRHKHPLSVGTRGKPQARFLRILIPFTTKRYPAIATLPNQVTIMAQP